MFNKLDKLWEWQEIKQTCLKTSNLMRQHAWLYKCTKKYDYTCLGRLYLITIHQFCIELYNAYIYVNGINPFTPTHDLSRPNTVDGRVHSMLKGLI